MTIYLKMLQLYHLAMFIVSKFAIYIINLLTIKKVTQLKPNGGKMKHKIKREDLLFLAIFLLILIVQLYKAKISIGSRDEHYYVTVGYRFFQGCSYFKDEWGIAQMIGFFLSPLVALYRTIFGGNEGIVLGFRYYYVIFTMFIGICIYFRFKNQYGVYAIFASSIYMLFTPFNIMALSYNTMSVGFLLLSLLIYRKNKIIRIIIAGILYGFSCINTPYLAMLYLAIIIIFIKKHISKRELFSISFGISIAAFLFLFTVFSKTTITSVLANLKHLISPSYSFNILYLIAYRGYMLIDSLNIVFFLLIFEMGYAIKNKTKENNHIIVFSVIITIFSIIYLGFINPSDISIGGHVLVLVPFTVLGIIIILLYNVDNYIKIIFFASLFHSFFIAISSDVGPRSFCAPLITACCITVLLLKNISDKKYIYSLCFCLIITLGFYKITNVYKLENIYGVEDSQTVLIDRGPLKGLYTNEIYKKFYDYSLDDINYINTLSGDYLISISHSTWEYLATEKKCGTSSTYIYFWNRESYEQDFQEYQTMHDDIDSWIYLCNDAPFEINKDSSWIKQFTAIKQLKNGYLLKIK